MTNRKKRVLLFMSKVDMGGIENLFLNVIPLLKDEFDFYITYYGDGENELQAEFEALGCEIHKLDCNRYRHPIRFINLARKYIRSKSIDVVHVNVGYSTFYGLLAAWCERVPIRIAHSHNSEFGVDGSKFKRLFELICKVTCHFCATTRINIGELSAHGLFFKSDSSLFIPNGIDLERFEYNSELRARIRQQLSISKTAPVLINISRLEPVKNHAFLLDIFSDFRKDHSDAHLLLVGSGSLEDAIRKHIDDLGLTQSVHLTGAVSNPEDYLSASDVFVMPSHHEGLSLAIIEAQKNGLPCMTSTSVDHACDATDSVLFLPLAAGAKEWAKHAVSLVGKRNLKPEDVRLNTYDMHSTAAKYRSIYRGDIQ